MAFGTPRGLQGVQVIQGQRQQRVRRNPEHSWWLQQVPFGIQPFMIAPVLPGETLENLLFQSRVVSEPIKNALIGWWCEYYFFYVKLQDLDDRAEFMQMVLDPAWTIANVDSTADTVSHYFNPGVNLNVNYVEKCLKRVTEEYFRDEGEAWNIVALSGIPLAAINNKGITDSFINDDSYQTAIEPTIDTSGASVGITTIEAAMRQWELLRAGNLTNMSFEDYLQSFGVKAEAVQEPYRPELIRYVREWTYPTNTIDAATGSPTSAVSWAISERADKKRFFTEPGFIFGVSCVRPKVYLANQKMPGASCLDTPYTWLPAVLSDDPQTSMRQYLAGTGLFLNNIDDYWVDVKDLFIHGDQFLNVDPTTAGINSLTLPSTAGVWKYPASQLELDRLFVAANAVIKQDGICRLTIAGSLRDTS